MGAGNVGNGRPLWHIGFASGICRTMKRLEHAYRAALHMLPPAVTELVL